MIKPVAQSSSAALNSASVVLHSLSEGQASALPILLLIHGCLEDAGKLVPLAEQLGSHHQVILADLPGHSNSPVIDDLTAFGMASAIRSALEGGGFCGEKAFDLVGHSLGAAVAIELAKLLPVVNQVILIEPTVKPRLLWPVREMLRAQYKSASNGDRRQFIENLCRSNFEYDIAAERFLPVTSFDWPAQIASLECPVRILVGDYQIPADPGCRSFPYLPSFFPADCYSEFSSIADLKIIQNSGHLLVYPQAAGYEHALIQIQDFLAPQQPIIPVPEAFTNIEPTVSAKEPPAPKPIADLYLDTIVSNEKVRLFNKLVESGFWWIDSIGETSAVVRAILVSRWGYPYGSSDDPLSSSWLLSPSTPACVASEWIGDSLWQNLQTVGLVVHPCHWFLRMYQRWGGETSHGQFINILASEISKPKEQRPIHEVFLTQHDRLSINGQINLSLWLREDELQANLHRCPGLVMGDFYQLNLTSSDPIEMGIEEEIIQKIKEVYAIDYNTFGFE